MQKLSASFVTSRLVRRAVFVAFGLTTGGVTLPACTESRIPPPQSSPSAVLSAGDVVPGDLDVVVRIDWAAVRAALPETAGDLATELLGRGPADVLAPLYLKADTVWVGFRPGPGLQPLDTVMVFSGHLGSFELGSRAEPGQWLPPRDLGGGWRRWDRARTGTRREWARIYQRHDSLVAALTVAEVDSVERVVERRGSVSRVRAPERGIVSAGVRLGPWLEKRGGPGFAWLGRASTLQAYLELVGSEAVAEADIGFEDEDQAARSADAVTLLQEALAGKLGRFDRLAKAIVVSSVGEHLILRYRGPLRFEEEQSHSAAGAAQPVEDGEDAPDSDDVGGLP